jgi:hypothetical protein
MDLGAPLARASFDLLGWLVEAGESMQAGG